jgi:peptidyl-prolyl cis-trans isomerase A (cyclophilin A)
LGLNAQTVRFQTTLGGIDVILTPTITPLTVANFMAYVSSGTYNNTIFHRSVPGFVLQGGGYLVQNHLPFLFQPNNPVANEFKTSNTR